MFKQAVSQLYAVKNLLIFIDLLQFPLDISKPRIIRIPCLLSCLDVGVLCACVISSVIEIICTNNSFQTDQTGIIPIHRFLIPQLLCLLQRLCALFFCTKEIIGFYILSCIFKILLHVFPFLHPVPAPQVNNKRDHCRDHDN